MHTKFWLALQKLATWKTEAENRKWNKYVCFLKERWKEGAGSTCCYVSSVVKSSTSTTTQLNHRKAYGCHLTRSSKLQHTPLNTWAGTAYRDSLPAERFGDRIPVGGENFSTLPDRPWVPSSLLHNAYEVSFPGVKRLVRSVDHPPHLALRLKKEQSYTSTPLLGLHGVF